MASSPTGRPRAHRMVLPAAVLVAAGSAAVVLHLADPNSPGIYPTCPFLAITGLYCPGCGSLRALHAITMLDVGTALARNPLAVLALAGLAVGFLRWAARRWTGRPRTGLAPAWLLYALAGLVVVYGVVRNLPGMTLLSPA